MSPGAAGETLLWGSRGDRPLAIIGGGRDTRLGPRVPEEIAGPRPLAGMVGRPLNFTVSRLLKIQFSSFDSIKLRAEVDDESITCGLQKKRIRGRGGLFQHRVRRQRRRHDADPLYSLRLGLGSVVWLRCHSSIVTADLLPRL